MTEVLRQGLEYDPMVNYGPDNLPPIDEQSGFFKYALLEGAGVQKPTRMAQGPLFHRCVEVMHLVDERVREVDPSFTAEHVMPMSYQSQEVRKQIAKMEYDERQKLTGIAEVKILSLQQIAVDRLHESPETPTLEPGLLDVPYYARQSEDWDGDGVRGCTNACFRMVFGAITGWTPSQAAVSERLVEQYGTSVVDDSVYSSIYQTEVFKEICDKDVATIELIGADFETIGKLATAFKRKRPHGEVYCTVNLASETAGAQVWHTSVLLGTEGDDVLYHDPSNWSGGAYKKASYDRFMRRWSVAYNRAVITIAG